MFAGPSTETNMQKLRLTHPRNSPLRQRAFSGCPIRPVASGLPCPCRLWQEQFATLLRPACRSKAVQVWFPTILRDRLSHAASHTLAPV